ncbi:site-2 protease family protein [Oscillatoria sp. FACHB-1407]|nr:site-2 protease family protein [Oscillatoria sp. FACHB-1407]MBD2464302.1 site-2 protease family protein [Oscillatoria sp. FACHB-1407]
MFFSVLLDDPVLFLRVVIIVILSVTLHELAHGFVAVTQGDDTPEKSGHLTLNPVVHMGWESIIFLCVAGIAWGQMPVNPSNFRIPKLSNILVSAAGPFLNLSLGLLFIGLMRIMADSSQELFSLEFFYLAARINLILFLFNLLPIPPLDGFHVLSEIIPGLKPLQNSPFGFFAMMVLFLLPGFGAGLAMIADVAIARLSGLPLM